MEHVHKTIVLTVSLTCSDVIYKVINQLLTSQVLTVLLP